jgi:hypothetical protein
MKFNKILKEGKLSFSTLKRELKEFKQLKFNYGEHRSAFYKRLYAYVLKTQKLNLFKNINAGFYYEKDKWDNIIVPFFLTFLMYTYNFEDKNILDEYKNELSNEFYQIVTKIKEWGVDKFIEHFSQVDKYNKKEIDISRKMNTFIK